MAKGVNARMVMLNEQQLKFLLRELPRRSIKKALRQSANAGATPVVKALRAAVPVESGAMKRAVKKKVKSYRDGNAIALIGADAAAVGEFKGRKRVPKNYWHLVIGGVRPHSLGKGSRLKRHDRNNREIQHGNMHPGFEGKDTLNYVMDAESSNVRRKMESKMHEVIVKETVKLAAK